MSEFENIDFTAEHAEPEKKKKKKKKHVGLKIFLILLLCALIGFPAYYGGRELYRDYRGAYENGGFKGVIGSVIGKTPAEESKSAENEPVEKELPAEIEEEVPVEQPASIPAPTPVPETPKAGMNAADVYEQNVNSTVAITTQATVNYWGQKISTAAKGSGFVVSDEGYILTNYHVIEDSESVTVAAYDGSEYDAAVIGFDESNDIAVLKIEDANLKAVTLGDSDLLRVGDEVIAIGNPLGELTFSMTKGYVSALNRPVQLSSNVSMSLIQTDCAINSGNSGGALFNMNGEVVGITNAKYSSSGSATEASIEGIGFAIPINSVYEIVQSIIENGYVLKPYIGVSIADLSEQTLYATGLRSGCLIAEVAEDGPAAKAGLQVNDIVVTANGENVDNQSSFVQIVQSCKPDDELVLGIYRQGEEKEITVIVGSSVSSVDTSSSTQKENAGQEYPGATPYDYFYNFGGNSMNDFFNYFFG